MENKNQLNLTDDHVRVIRHSLYTTRNRNTELLKKMDPNLIMDYEFLKVQVDLIDEMFELIEASMTGTHADKISEGLDVFNTVIAWLASEGVCDPLHAGWQKLQVTAAKYRAERAANDQNTEPG